MSSDLKYMRLALDEAAKGFGWVSPNPPVGCVIVSKDNKILATGFHKRLGEAHAEADALNKISDSSLLNKAKIYVTLEPCAHEGRTPSCAKRIAKLPVAEVIYGVVDPNPLVAGSGLKIIEAAGISVRKSPVLEEEINTIAEHFLFNQIQKKAFITLKIATSLDGQIALKNGESKWITGDSTRLHARVNRGYHDAVMVGAGTVLKDNPTLNLRETLLESKKLKLIIYDPKNKIKSLDKTLNVFQSFESSYIYFVKPKTAAQVGPNKNIFDDLVELNKNLYNLGIYSVFVEGGSYLQSQLIRVGSINKVLLYMAPKIIGSKNGLSWTKDFEIKTLKESLNFKKIKTELISTDVLITCSN